ncbi:MAG TPA: response regulator [Bdellovibrionota bacterium]|nr:response regulator [Bdellovibrionota bacterium]
MNISKNYKIMIVDDNEKNVALVEQQLSQSGYKTAICYSGNEAIDKIEEENPDLILLDVMMPNLDGYQTCKILKERLAHKFLPIILLTVKDEAESKIKGFTEGADDYLTKPYDLQELLVHVQNMLHLVEADREKQKLMDFYKKTESVFHELEALLEGLQYSLKKIEDTVKKDNPDLAFAKNNIQKILKRIKDV